MSASSKKKLRKEQEAAKLTEKQRSAQKEDAKTKLYTAAFVVVMAALLVVAIVVGVTKTISNSGVRERNTTALTVGSHQISNAELNYFYMDAVNNFYSNYGSYAAMFGLDVTAPLNEQVVDEETGRTWADDFLSSAEESAKAAYAMADAAEAAGFALPEDQAAQLENMMSSLDIYATMYGYSNGETYLKAIYGKGATKEGYLEYCKLNNLASAYYQEYTQSLTYTDADLRSAEAENFDAYSSYTFYSYYMPTSKFLEGGTTGEDGTTTYTDEEKAAAAEAVQAAAESLIGEEITSVEALDAAIAALPVNEGVTTSSTAYKDTAYSSINSLYLDWLTSADRKEGDKAVFPNNSTTTDADGKETSTLNGYYVLYYIGSNDNTFPLANVRHILVSFTGGTTDENGNTVYSDEEKATAKASAEEILKEWKSGAATEDSFAELANAKSDDGDGTTGGLYENVYPGQMVTNFNNWCFEDSRKAGDTGIVETEYGYHVMYYVGDSNTNYRDYQIESQLRSADADQWYTDTVEALTMTEGNTSYIRKDLVLSVQ